MSDEKITDDERAAVRERHPDLSDEMLDFLIRAVRKAERKKEQRKLDDNHPRFTITRPDGTVWEID